MTCPHHWRVASLLDPDTGLYPAVCKLCGLTRSFAPDPEAATTGPRRRVTRFTREESLQANARRWKRTVSADA